jgi:uncharacterized protein YbaP (TraB family)
VEQLKRRMDRSGVVFVAVGAGHLTGANSVLERLRKAGFQVLRLRD